MLNNEPPGHVMSDVRSFSSGARYLIIAAAMVVVIAGLRVAQEILVPTILAAFLAIIVAPAFGRLRRRGVPTAVALILMVGIVTMLIVAAAALIGPSLNGFLNAVPEYMQQVEDHKQRIVDWASAQGFDVSDELQLPYFDVKSAVGMIANLVGGLTGLFSSLFLVLLIMVFMLVEASGMSAKVCAISGEPEESLLKLRSVLVDMRRYLTLKTLISLLTGLLVAAWLKWLGVDYALLWGLLAFALNFIPNVGSIIAAIPAVCVAWMQLHLDGALYATLGYLVINVVIGQILEPRLLGERLGLSALVVFLSLLFWGWLWGPIGMLLSVPLTMVVKIALAGAPETRSIAILMGSDVAAGTTTVKTSK